MYFERSSTVPVQSEGSGSHPSRALHDVWGSVPGTVYALYYGGELHRVKYVSSVKSLGSGLSEWTHKQVEVAGFARKQVIRKFTNLIQRKRKKVHNYM